MNEVSKMKKNSEDAANLLKSLAHPQRLLILCYLSQGDLNVSEIVGLTGISQSQASQFLARFTKEGIVQAEKKKNYIYYSIVDIKTKKLIQSMYKIFCK